MSASMQLRPAAALFCVVTVLVLLLAPGAARADAPAAPARASEPGASSAAFPDHLALDEAVRMFRAGGVDLLLADQAAHAAAGAVVGAEQVRNPTATALAGPTFNQSTDPPCSGCSRVSLVYGLADNGAALDALAGKRGLRVRQALETLASVKARRADVERLLVGQVKTAYVEVALTKGALDFSLEVQKTLEQTLELTQKRYPGVISEAELARVETQKLEGDQQVALAEQALRNARITLALLLGARSRVPDFTVDPSWLGFRVPPALEVTNEPALLRAAQARRPDVAAAAHAALAAQRGKELAERRRIPDVTLSMQVSGIGLGQQAASPAVLVLGASTNLPLFYQQEGEIKRAGAAVDVATLTHAKVQALVAADVAGSVATFRATRSLVERMETQLLPRARIARDVLAMQFHAGKAHLMDFLDAQRQYIATRLEYFDDLDAYWSAVFNVEQALGIEVTP